MTMDPAGTLQQPDVVRPAARNRAQPTRCAHLQGLRMLTVLRVTAPLAQALTVWIVTSFYDVAVHKGGVTVVLALEAIVAALTVWRLRHRPRIGEIELFLQAQLDVLLYAAMLYFTGGAMNPFGPMFLLPVVIVAAALRPRWVWAIAGTTIVAYMLLRWRHVDIVQSGAAIPFYALYENGLVVSYLITAALVVFFCNHMHATLRDGERTLSEVRDMQLRDESATAMGALGATYAHELSSPLSTIAVTVSELRRRSDLDATTQRDLDVVAEQIASCKRIISQLASAGGARRAEAASAVRVDRFIERTVDRARALHPGASIAATFNGATPAPLIVGDETLTQAMLMLMHTATLASQEQVDVATTWDPEQLLVEVRNRGHGYPTETLARLQGSLGDASLRPGGADLDLLSAAQMLERLGGKLEVCNVDGGGARAVIRIPMQSIVLESGHAASAHGHTEK